MRQANHYMWWFWSKKWAENGTKMSSIWGGFFSKYIDDIAVFQELFKIKRLSSANILVCELGLFLLYMEISC